MISITQITNEIYVLKDSTNSCANLVIGKKKVLLFDTGFGIDNMSEAVKTITTLPLLVIASHGHIDHIGGSNQFHQVFLSKEDMPILNAYNDELITQWIRSYPNESMKEFSTHNWKNIYPLNFDSFDLGNRKCMIIPLYGHTKGSIGIYIPDLKLLLSGDALTPVMCLNFTNHLSKEIQYETLNKLQQLDFDYYLTSHHNEMFKKSMIQKLMNCIKNSENKKHYQYQYPYPPFSQGRIYVDSFEESIAIIIE